MKRNGFTLIELMIVIAIVTIVGIVISSIFLNNRGATEARAYQGMERFIAMNGIQDIKRKTCAGDSENDGYGTCTITTNTETITIACPTNWGDIVIFGASSCKEIPIVRMQVR